MSRERCARPPVVTFSADGVPSGLATRKELAEQGLVPGGQPAAGRVWSARGSGWVALFARSVAVPARPASLADLAASTDSKGHDRPVVVGLGQQRPSPPRRKSRPRRAAA